MLTEERINSNYMIFLKKLQEYRCYSEEMINDIGERIKNAPYTLAEKDGGAYRGALLDITLFKLCIHALNMNKGFATSAPCLNVNNEMLVRVLLLLNISKAVMMEEETDSWKLKRGFLYRFAENSNIYFRMGERSLFLCNKYGIRLEEEEMAAILLTDSTEENLPRIKESPLCQIVMAVRDIVSTQIFLESKNGK